MNVPFPTYPWYGGVQPTYSPNQNPYSIQPTTTAPQFTRSYISGRLVTTPDEIQPNEVVMDGTVSLFPTKDYKTIYAKQWNSDGTISTIEYQPVVSKPSATSEPSLDPTLTSYIDGKFAELEKLIKRQQKPYQKKEDNNANGSSNVRA